MLDAAGPWGTGPFILASGVSTLDKRSPEVVLEPNTKYWNEDRIPKVRIVFDNIISKEDALKQVTEKSGKVDIVTFLTPQEAKAIDDNAEHAKIVASDAKTVLVGVINLDEGSPWKDVKLRKALNNAIDKDKAIEKGALGYGNTLGAMIQKGRFGYNSDLDTYDYDEDEAKEALAKLGKKDVTIATDDAHKPTAESIAEDLKAIGLEPKIVDDKSKEWDIKLVEHFDWTPEFPAGVVHREFFGKDGAFRSGPEWPEFDKRYAKIVATTDEDKQEEHVQDLEKLVYDDARVVFLYSPQRLYAVSDRVSNFTPYDSTVLELAETTKEEDKKAEK